MSGLSELAEAIRENPELQEKITEEIKRLTRNREASGVKEAFARAIRNVLGIDVAPADMKAFDAGRGEPETGEPARASGG